MKPAVDLHGRLRLLERARQRYADMRVLGFSGPVDDASHDRDAQLLDAGMHAAPLGHPFAKVRLDVLGHLLKERRRGTATAGTGSDLWREAANVERLEDLLGDANLFGAVTARSRRERDPNRVANSFGQHDGQSSGAGDDSLASDARFGETEVQRIVTPLCQTPIRLGEIG